MTGEARRDLTITVVICCFTLDRWDDLVTARMSLASQTRAPDRVVVVVDHDAALLAAARSRFADTVVVANTGTRGLSDARNTGVNAAGDADVVLFLDDDAAAEPEWVERMIAPFADPAVAGVSGFAVPRWDAPGRPSWFPEEFLWVVGCSHRGLPADGGLLRNPVGSAMAFRRSALQDAGGFVVSLGRVGRSAGGCEETELSLRVLEADPSATIRLAAGARVHHRVRADRQTIRYFVRRCVGEGISKAGVERRHRSGDVLRTERAFARTTLLSAWWHALRRGVVRLDRASLVRAAMIAMGLVATGAGFVVGRFRAEDDVAPPSVPLASAGVPS